VADVQRYACLLGLEQGVPQGGARAQVGGGRRAMGMEDDAASTRLESAGRSEHARAAIGAGGVEGSRELSRATSVGEVLPPSEPLPIHTGCAVSFTQTSHTAWGPSLFYRS
jgi:hypothetical protein